jgi:hypothetical protein
MRFDTGLPTGSGIQLQMQVCADCGHTNYPRRELCGDCLADALDWQPVDPNGTVQSLTELHYSLEDDYAAHLPWRVGSVKLDCGPVAFAHLAPGVESGQRVALCPFLDKYHNRMLVALGPDSPAEWLEAINFREDLT